MPCHDPYNLVGLILLKLSPHAISGVVQHCEQRDYGDAALPGDMFRKEEWSYGCIIVCMSL